MNIKMLKQKDGLFVDPYGDKFYYLNNRLHREDGPAIEFVGGDTVWYLNGKRHRVGGPAVETTSGTKKWFYNGLLHRLDGPAIETTFDYSNEIFHEWYLNGEYVDVKSQREFEQHIAFLAFL
jgi:hypothetical protein